MTDAYQPIRDYAQQQLGNYDDRNQYIAHVLGFAALQGSDELMAQRIAAHAWDSTPYKVIPHVHLSPADIPAGAQSPTGILTDVNLTLDVARRIRDASTPTNGSAGQSAPGAPVGSQTG